MKIILKEPFRENIYVLMRRMGYHFQREDKERKELVFTRPARGFPRFHLFIKKNGNDLIFSLHLDQKRPIYKGTPAHAGEYNSKVVKEEVERIREILKSLK